MSAPLSIKPEDEKTFQTFMRLQELDCEFDPIMPTRQSFPTIPNEYKDALSYTTNYLATKGISSVSLDNPEHKRLLAIGLNLSKDKTNIATWDPEVKKTALNMMSAWQRTSNNMGKEGINSVVDTAQAIRNTVTSPLETGINVFRIGDKFITTSQIHSIYPEGITKKEISFILKQNLAPEARIEFLTKAHELNSEELDIYSQAINKLAEDVNKTKNPEQHYSLTQIFNFSQENPPPKTAENNPNRLETNSEPVPTPTPENDSLSRDETRNSEDKNRVRAFLFSRTLSAYFSQDNLSHQSEDQAKNNKKILLKEVERQREDFNLKLEQIEAYRSFTPDAIETSVYQLVNNTGRTRITQKEKEQNAKDHLSLHEELSDQRQKSLNKERALRENLKELDQSQNAFTKEYQKDRKKADKACEKAHRLNNFCQLVNLIDFSKAELPMVQNALARLDPSGIATAAIGPIISQITQKNIQRAEKKRAKIDDKFKNRCEKVDKVKNDTLNNLAGCQQETSIIADNLRLLISDVVKNPDAYHPNLYRENLLTGLKTLQTDFLPEVMKKEEETGKRIQDIQTQRTFTTNSINSIQTEKNEKYAKDIAKEQQKIQEYQQEMSKLDINNKHHKKKIAELQYKINDRLANINYYEKKRNEKYDAKLGELTVQKIQLDNMLTAYNSQLDDIKRDKTDIEGEIKETNDALEKDERYSAINAYTSDVIGKMEADKPELSADGKKIRQDLNCIRAAYKESAALREEVFDVIDKFCRQMDPYGSGWKIPFTKKKLPVSTLGSLLKAGNAFYDLAIELNKTIDACHQWANKVPDFQGNILNIFKELKSEETLRQIILPSILTLAQGATVLNLIYICFNGAHNPTLNFLITFKEEIEKKLQTLDKKTEQNTGLIRDVKKLLQSSDQKLDSLSYKISKGDNELTMALIKSHRQNQKQSELQGDAKQVSHIIKQRTRFINNNAIKIVSHSNLVFTNENIDNFMTTIRESLKTTYVDVNNGLLRNEPIISLQTISKESLLFAGLISSLIDMKNTPNFYLLSTITHEYIQFMQRLLFAKQDSQLIHNNEPIILQTLHEILVAHCRFASFLSLGFTALHQRAVASNERLKLELDSKKKSQTLRNEERANIELENSWKAFLTATTTKKGSKLNTISVCHLITDTPLSRLVEEEWYIQEAKNYSDRNLEIIAPLSIGLMWWFGLTGMLASCAIRAATANANNPVEAVKRIIDCLNDPQDPPMNTVILRINNIFNGTIQTILKLQSEANNQNINLMTNHIYSQFHQLNGTLSARFTYHTDRWNLYRRFDFNEHEHQFWVEREGFPNESKNLLTFDLKAKLLNGVMNFEISENANNILKIEEILQAPALTDLDRNFEANAKILLYNYKAFLSHLLDKEDLSNSNVFEKIKNDCIPIRGEEEGAIPLVFPKKRVQEWVFNKIKGHFLLDNWTLSIRYKCGYSSSEKKYYIYLTFHYFDTENTKHTLEPLPIGKIDQVSLHAFNFISFDSETDIFTLNNFDPSEVLPLFCYKSLLKDLGLPGKDSKETSSGIVIPSMTEVKDDFFSLWNQSASMVEYDRLSSTFIMSDIKYSDQPSSALQLALQIKIEEFLQSSLYRQHQEDLTFLQAYCQLISSNANEVNISHILGFLDSNFPFSENPLNPAGIDPDTFKQVLWREHAPSLVVKQAHEQKQQLIDIADAILNDKETKSKKLTSPHVFLDLRELMKTEAGER